MKRWFFYIIYVMFAATLGGLPAFASCKDALKGISGLAFDLRTGTWRNDSIDLNPADSVSIGRAVKSAEGKLRWVSSPDSDSDHVRFSGLVFDAQMDPAGNPTSIEARHLTGHRLDQLTWQKLHDGVDAEGRPFPRYPRSSWAYFEGRIEAKYIPGTVYLKHFALCEDGKRQLEQPVAHSMQPIQTLRITQEQHQVFVRFRDTHALLTMFQVGMFLRTSGLRSAMEDLADPYPAEDIGTITNAIRAEFDQLESAHLAAQAMWRQHQESVKSLRVIEAIEIPRKISQEGRFLTTTVYGPRRIIRRDHYLTRLEQNRTTGATELDFEVRLLVMGPRDGRANAQIATLKQETAKVILELLGNDVVRPETREGEKVLGGSIAYPEPPQAIQDYYGWFGPHPSGFDFNPSQPGSLNLGSLVQRAVVVEMARTRGGSNLPALPFMMPQVTP